MVFIEVFRNGRNWSERLIFWLILRVFILYSFTLYELRLKSWPNRRSYLDIHVVSFIRIAFVVVKLKIF